MENQWVTQQKAKALYDRLDLPVKIAYRGINERCRWYFGASMVGMVIGTLLAIAVRPHELSVLLFTLYSAALSVWAIVMYYRNAQRREQLEKRYQLHHYFALVREISIQDTSLDIK